MRTDIAMHKKNLGGGVVKLLSHRRNNHILLNDVLKSLAMGEGVEGIIAHGKRGCNDEPVIRLHSRKCVHVYGK